MEGVEDCQSLPGSLPLPSIRLLSRSEYRGCLFSALSRGIGALQVSIVIIKLAPQPRDDWSGPYRFAMSEQRNELSGDSLQP